MTTDDDAASEMKQVEMHTPETQSQTFWEMLT